MKTTRRTFLGGAAVASLPVAANASGAVTAIQAESAASAPVSENPDLIDAHGRLIAARAELDDAKSALEWIADEWRHRWPLAPEELVNFPLHTSRDQESAERDIVGNHLYRDTSDLTVRFTKKYRQENPRGCFTLHRADDTEKGLAFCVNSIPTGRTQKALDRNRVEAAERIERLRRRLELARAYEAETAALRKAAGVDRAKERISIADDAFYDVCSEISKIPAFGPEGLQIKLEALNATGVFASFECAEGIIGEMARFIKSAVGMQRGVSL